MTRSRLDVLVDDLVAEHASLDSVVGPLTGSQLAAPTPAEGWSIVDQVSHLAGFDDAACLALEAPARFLDDLDIMIRDGDDPVARYLERGRSMSGADVVGWWRASHEQLVIRARSADPAVRVPWFGPPMSAMSFVTARLMEIWAHGQDVRDSLGVAPSVSPRLRHIAHIGVGALAYSFTVHDRAVPTAPIDVVLRAPDGADDYCWGPGDAADRVTGDALDFCLVVTQRRHVRDTALDIHGPAAVEWMSIAEAFAGGAGAGRAPLS